MTGCSGTFPQRSDTSLQTTRVWRRDEHRIPIWLNWLVQFAVAVATFAAVIVALFGNYMHARFWPPQLKLTPKGLAIGT